MLGAVLLGPPVAALDTLAFLTPGAPPDLEKSLRAASPLLAAQQDKMTNPQDLLAAARSEYGRLLGALYADGFYSGVIGVRIDGQEAAAIPALAAPDRINNITVTVTPGPRFNFSRAQVAPLAAGTVLPARFADGRIARAGIIQQAATVALEGWRSAGHAKARVTSQQITADHAARLVDARLAIAPGPVVRFGPFTLGGETDVRPERVRAIAGFPVGEVFDPAALEKSANRLRRTGAFKSVTLSEAEALGPGDTLAIGVALSDQPKRRLSFGAEIASLDGATLSAAWQHRNLFGGAEQLRIDGKVSGIGGTNGGADYSLGARLTRPGTPDPDTDAYLEARLEHENEPGYDTTRGSIGLGYTRILSDTFSGTVGLAFTFEQTTDALGTAQFATLSLPLGVIWERRDDPLNPAAGTYTALDVTPFLGINNTGSGARLAFDGRAYQGFGAEKRIVLAGRMQAGAVLGPSIARTPRDFLFFSGGGGSVRGQPYQSLGVSTPCGTGCTVDTGGRSFLGLSGEVRAGLGKNFGLVAFADAGYVSATLFSGGAWHSGAGLGLRYNTGIGPIRLDVAAPVGGTTGDGVQVYVGIGQSF